MATKAEIRQRVAEDLGRIRHGGGMQYHVQVRIDEGYDEVYARLKKEGLNTWASTAEVPTEIVPYMVALVALNCTASFGVSQERYNRIVLVAGPDGNLAVREIRSLVQPEYESMSDAEDY